MKPPRVFKKSGHWYLRFHIPGRKNAVDRATGLEADTDDWKKSRHVKLIRAKIKEVEEERFKRVHGTYYTAAKRISYESLLEEFNKANAIEKGIRSASTLRHRELAVKFICKHLDVTPASIKRPDVIKLRDLGLKTLSPASVRGYFTELRILHRFAVREGYAKEQVFDGIAVSVPHKRPVEILLADEYKLFTFLYHKRRDLFYQTLFQRLTGLRVTDVCNLKWSAIGRTLYFLNSKGKRWEEYPITPAIQKLIDETPRHGDYVFDFRSPKTVNDYLTRGCAFAGIPRITTHQLKRNYLRECALERPDPRTFDLLAHHLPTINALAVEHYSGKSLVLMAETLTTAQTHWLRFLEAIPAITDGKEYLFSNPNKNRGRTGANKNATTKVAFLNQNGAANET